MITRRRYNNTLPYIYNFSIGPLSLPVYPRYVYAGSVSEGNPASATGIIIGYLTMGYTKYTVQELNETLKLTYEALDADRSILTPSQIKKIYFKDDDTTSNKYPLCIDFDVCSDYYTFWSDNGYIVIYYDNDGFNDIDTYASIDDYYMRPSLYIDEVVGQITLPFNDSDISITTAIETTTTMSYHTKTFEATFEDYTWEDGYVYEIPEYEMHTVDFTSMYSEIYVGSIEINGYAHIGDGNDVVVFDVQVGRQSVTVDCYTTFFGYNGNVPRITVTIGYYSFDY